MNFASEKLRNFLSKYYIVQTIYAFIAAFASYFCAYAYRKPFSASSYEGHKIWGVNYKIMLITLQAIGYTISKFAGIKIVSELNPKNRGNWILLAILVAEITLILFGAVPTPYNAIFMLLNGLPLGIIWGVVFSFVEGRRTSELLGSGMCVSFIVSSGAVKAVGKSFTNNGVSEFWMPAVVGAVFYPILVLFVFLLNSLPPPNDDDIKSRTVRVEMNNADRIRLFKEFWPGIVLMTVFYMTLTAYRDFRDNFAAELWIAFGYSGEPSVFATSELIVAILVVVPIGLFMLIKKHIYGLIAYHILILVGMVIVFLSGILNDFNHVTNGLAIMVMTGVGLYFAYVPFNSILFDLLLSTYEYKANSGFLMYICDSFGYLLSVVILFIKNFATPNLSWLNFYIKISYIMGVLGFFLMCMSLLYYLLKYKKWTNQELNELEYSGSNQNSTDPLEKKDQDEGDVSIEQDESEDVDPIYNSDSQKDTKESA